MVLFLLLSSSHLQMTSKVNIKHVLDSLCSVFSQLTAVKIGAEDFRQAKLNEPTSTHKLWLLVYALLNLINNNTNNNLECDQKFQLPELLYVQRELVKLGFSDSTLLNATQQHDIDHFSSRSLLIVVGWLLSTQDLVDLILVRLDTYDDLIERQLPYREIIDEAHALETANIAKLMSSNNNNSNNKLNYLKYLKLSHQQNLNSYYGCLIERQAQSNHVISLLII